MIEKEREELKRPTIIDISKLNRINILLLSKRIKLGSGVAVAIVHPYFRQYDDEYTGNIYLLEEKRGHARDLEKFIEASSGVIFVFEEESKITSAQRRFSFLRSQALICFVPTGEKEATPKICSSSFPETLQWKAVIAKMRRAGVKKLLVGGRNYYNDEEGEGGCVNGLKNSLGSEFEISLIPELCYPDKPALFE